QREQARKISHSAIERRRRERINDKIMQLKQIIPACADQENLHKMSILQSAIDYINHLKEIVDKRQQ
ncbi:Myc-type, basic helix-loop-helix domain-containing protein, partial [Absidia repens]